MKTDRTGMAMAIVTLLVVATAGVLQMSDVWPAGIAGSSRSVVDSAPKVSPFTNVQFEQQQIIVTYQERDYQWLELDGIKVQDIEAAAKWRFWELWQKRVSEDLVAVLWGMDHQPGDTVSLLLRDPETNEQRLVEQAPMTRENRSAVYQTWRS